MPQLMQVKILRVLQEKLFTPVGANREISSNVRIIAATNRPLEDMMKAGTFREDLFYRLNVVPIFLPELNARKNDLDTLIKIFIKKFNRTQNKKITGLTKDASATLSKYSWPGNIRELENVIEHAFVLESTNQITLGSLPEAILEAVGINMIDSLDKFQSQTNSMKSLSNSSANSMSDYGADLSDDGDMDSDLDADDLDVTGDDTIPFIASENSALDFNAQKEEFEKQFIIKALKTFKGRINQTAIHANIPKKTLLRKIEKYGIVAKEYALQKSDD
jgi:transcriptional regulator with PAS, ATPase and Fis domain